MQKSSHRPAREGHRRVFEFSKVWMAASVCALAGSPALAADETVKKGARSAPGKQAASSKAAPTAYAQLQQLADRLQKLETRDSELERQIAEMKSAPAMTGRASADAGKAPAGAAGAANRSAAASGRRKRNAHFRFRNQR
jgi:hypothetical protein